MNKETTSVLDAFLELRERLKLDILGQHTLVERLLLAMLADGHLLVEGAPGLAKTRAVKMLGETIEGDFHRIQFTPDLLPSDVTGTEIYRPQEALSFSRKDPFSTIWCLPMKSTGLLPRSNPLCWRRWGNDR